MRKVSIAIPTWQRYTFTINSFAQVLGDERVSEVVISDDASKDYSYENLKAHFRDEPKVKIFQNEKNIDCYANKHAAAERSIGDYVIVLDSDNVITTKYLDAIYAIPEWDEKTIYQPSFLRPHFDFRKWEGLTITKENVAEYVDTHLMTMMNAANHFINRNQYLKVWDGSVNPGSSDSLYFSTCWLESGGKIYVTPNLTYDHYISDNNDGHYQQNSHKYVNFHKELMKRIKQLK